MTDKTKFWKYLAITAAGMYVFQVARKNGGTLAGNPEGVKLNKEKIMGVLAGLTMQHPAIREPLENAVSGLLNKITGKG